MLHSITRDRSIGPSSGSLVVLGLDPGTLVTGYGMIERSEGHLRLITCGTIRNDPEESMPSRLHRIHSELVTLIDQHHPDEFAIESAFYGKNAQSALKLGHARGVSMLAAVERGVPVSEYSPREVKKAVVGKGTASKEQVRFMVRSLLGVRGMKISLDASDALAVALCHLHRRSGSRALHRDWKSFVESHPERVMP